MLMAAHRRHWPWLWLFPAASMLCGGGCAVSSRAVKVDFSRCEIKGCESPDLPVDDIADEVSSAVDAGTARWGGEWGLVPVQLPSLADSTVRRAAEECAPTVDALSVVVTSLSGSKTRTIFGVGYRSLVWSEGVALCELDGVMNVAITDGDWERLIETALGEPREPIWFLVRVGAYRIESLASVEQ